MNESVHGQAVQGGSYYYERSGKRVVGADGVSDHGSQNANCTNMTTATDMG